MSNKFVYSCNVKICASWFNKLLESIFCLLLVLGAFSLQKVIEMLEDMVVSWWEVRRIWQMKQNFIAQFVQPLKCWLCEMQWGIVVENNWTLFVDLFWCWLQVFQFWVHLIDLLSILLRCNGFARIQKAVLDQTSSRPPVTISLCFGASLVLGSASKFLLSPTTELVITGCHTKSTFCRTSQSNREMLCCCCIE